MTERRLECSFGDPHPPSRAAELAEADRTGEIPDGRGEDFATGGCFGEAAREVGSIWTARRNLEDEYQRLREQVASSPEMAATKAAYTTCTTEAGFAASDPAELETGLAEGAASPELVTSVRSACGEVWATGYRRAEASAVDEFITRNESTLNASKGSYTPTRCLNSGLMKG